MTWWRDWRTTVNVPICDLSDPCQLTAYNAQEPRTEAEEKSYSSYCRAKEAVR